MNEDRLMWQLLVAINLLSLTTWLYAKGGRAGAGKAWRRFGAGLLWPLGCLGLTAWAHHFSPWMLLSLPAYVLALHQGYGAVGMLGKVVRRFWYGLCLGACSLTFLMPLGLTAYGLIQTVLAVAFSVLYGVKNPTSAVSEEAVIWVMSVAMVPFLVMR